MIYKQMNRNYKFLIFFKRKNKFLILRQKIILNLLIFFKLKELNVKLRKKRSKNEFLYLKVNFIKNNIILIHFHLNGQFNDNLKIL